MELREFAERVLFATSLEEKLRPPDAITDAQPGAALAAPVAPGRPGNLIFKPHGTGKSEFPGLHRLEDETERGKLLHFFANHELLATELMALVLLKFPDAPAAFRKGVLRTLQDEQAHTRLYLERMRACGVAPGDFPVSGYFWRCVAPMAHPMDYVAGLCLTFEQANLDFAGHYGRAFAAVGDADSAKLLGKIYHDEIGHVAYGLKWFRRWKNPASSDWDAFCRALKFPLSPQRAKGFSVNAAGRQAAGLDADFIARLNVYSQSKGRTPGVFVFNPFTEGFLAEGKAFNPTKHQAQLARDLENLPQFLGRQDDLVLVRRAPSVEFLSGIRQAGFPLPEFVEVGPASRLPAGGRLARDDVRGRDAPQDGQAGRLSHGNAATSIVGQASCLPDRGRPAREQSIEGETPDLKTGETPVPLNFAGRKLGRLRPWAWGPDSFELLRPLFSSVTGEQRTDASRFNEEIARLYSKAWSAEFLRKILRGTGSDSGWLCSENEAGVAVNSLTEALAATAQIRARGQHNVVAKEALGVAGSNALRLLEPEILPAQKRWLEKAFAQRRELVIEPWLERLVDFSAQLEMSPDGLKLCGFTGLLTDARGQFIANFAEPHHHQRIPANVVSQFAEPKDIARRLLDFYDRVFAALENELRAAGFVGPVGIDALVYRDATGAARLKPVVEINPRYTMGRVLVELMRRTGQNSHGAFRLVNAAQLRAEGCADFPAYARRLAENFPLRLEGEPVPRIREGALCLNDPATAQVCLAVFQASGTAERRGNCESRISNSERAWSGGGGR